MTLLSEHSNAYFLLTEESLYQLVVS